ncbi:MAG: tetratricopeptide repeat protein [Planctomycetes bacterium]|nr:tetratricopeptide repeat protein [Planctomycetota bacterium]MCC7173029.1 tetratricopeptide repeat protein [Planctomycetota bacterium]
MTMRAGAWFVALCAVGSLSACSQFAPHARNESTDPDQRLAQLVERLEAARAQGPRNDAIADEQTAFLDAGLVRSDIARFTLEYPRHIEGLWLNARLAYEAGEPENAVSYLDRVLTQDVDHAEAAVLRGRIALEQGNAQFARKLLERHVDRSPDHAELREAYAAALFYVGDPDGARRELDTAERLGAPAWRVLYHRGLIAEKSGEIDLAKQLYAASVAAAADSPAAQRLRAL